MKIIPVDCLPVTFETSETNNINLEKNKTSNLSLDFHQLSLNCYFLCLFDLSLSYTHKNKAKRLGLCGCDIAK